MSERLIGYMACLGLIGLVISCALYMEGGRKNKIIRRLGGAFVLALTVFLLSLFMGLWNYVFIVIFPLLFAGFSMGYGANIGYIKVIRRSVYALFICLSGLVICIVIGGNSWFILPLHVGVALWSVWLGVKNPMYAAAEEVFVCALLNIGLIMYPFINYVK